MTKLRLHEPSWHEVNSSCCASGSTATLSVLHRQIQYSCKLVLFFLITSTLYWQTPGHTSGLELAEQQKAAELAAQAPWPAKQSQKRESHPLGTQTLFIERQENKHLVHGRIARVYQYDYSWQAARLLVINLDTQSIAAEQAIHSVHLPLNPIEIDFARNLLAAETALMDRLRAEQILRAVQPFDSLIELDVKASIFEPQDESHPCARSRCALLSLFDATRTVFTLEPIVFLTTQRVGLLQEYSALACCGNDD